MAKRLPENRKGGNQHGLSITARKGSTQDKKRKKNCEKKRGKVIDTRGSRTGSNKGYTKKSGGEGTVKLESYNKKAKRKKFTGGTKTEVEEADEPHEGNPPGITDEKTP